MIARLTAGATELDIENSNLKEVAATEVSLKNWFEDATRVSLFPYAMSLCVFENCPPEEVQWGSVQLQKSLLSSGFKAETFGALSLLRNSEKLALIGAKEEFFQPDDMPYALKYIRFIDMDFKAAFLGFVWREMDQLREPIIEWWVELLRLKLDVQPVAFTIFLVARNEFGSIYARIILPWLRGTDLVRADCADLALSILGSDPTVLSFVENSLERIIQEADHISGFDLVFRLIFGYTGMLLPEAAFLKLMRLIEIKFENDVCEASVSFQENVLRRLQQNINRLASKASEGIYAINAFRNLIKYLSILVKEKEQVNKSHFSTSIALTFLAAVTNNLGAQLQDPISIIESGPTREADTKIIVDKPTPTPVVASTSIATEPEPSVIKDTNFFDLETLLTKDGLADEETISATAYVLATAVSGSDIKISNFVINSLLRVWCPQKEIPAAARNDFIGLARLIETALKMATSDRAKEKIAYAARFVTKLNQ